MATPEVTLRRVDASRPAVWARIVAMDALCFNDGSPALSNNNGAWWIATANGEEAGYCGISRNAASGYGYLCRAGVLPKYRGKGLQKVFIRRRLAFAKAHGWTTVVTDTHKNNASANNLIDCGFRLYSPQVKWSFETGQYWRKSL